MHATCPNYVILLHFIILITCRTKSVSHFLSCLLTRFFTGKSHNSRAKGTALSVSCE
jgi:hypothetical protein